MTSQVVQSRMVLGTWQLMLAQGVQGPAAPMMAVQGPVQQQVALRVPQGPQQVQVRGRARVRLLRRLQRLRGRVLRTARAPSAWMSQRYEFVLLYCTVVLMRTALRGVLPLFLYWM